jgi:hypothetical protein
MDMNLSTQNLSPSTTVAEGSGVEIPSNFICPITLQVMVSPLMTRTGINFERAAIIGWLEQGSGRCPLTRKPLTNSDLITNRRLKARIGMWRANNGIPEPTEEETAAAERKLGSFIKMSGGKKGEIAQLSQQPLTLVSALRSNLPDDSIPSPSLPQRARR